MKYLNMGTPDYEVYVPPSPIPLILETREGDVNVLGELVLLQSRLCYPERVFLSPLKPKEVVKRFQEANGKSDVPGLNYDD